MVFSYANVAAKPVVKTVTKTQHKPKKTTQNKTRLLQKTQWDDVVFYEVGVSSFHQPENTVEYMT
jgi:1,4-alpha-glucan branching enzyme